MGSRGFLSSSLGPARIVRTLVGVVFVGLLSAGILLAGLVAVMFLAAAVLEQGFIVGAALLALFGGGLAAMALARRRGGAVLEASSKDGPVDLINMSRIRVAGIGGLGLVVVALATALEFDLAFFVLLAGLLGGAAGAGLMILLRHRGLANRTGDPPVGVSFSRGARETGHTSGRRWTSRHQPGARRPMVLGSS